jgi:hypothetical protein
MTLITSNSTSPAMSVIVFTPEGFAHIGQIVKHLAAQTVSEKLELVIIHMAGSTVTVPAEYQASFARLVWVAIADRDDLGQVRAAGARAATAPIIAFAEDHAFPIPTWAEQFLEAHQGPWAAVGPSFANGNPASQISWADFMLNFGNFAEESVSGVTTLLPWHNISYKRDVLLGYGPRLADLLSVEGNLLADLQAQGQKLYMAAQAQIRHVNISILSFFIQEHLHAGRLFGGMRVSQNKWPGWRRLGYAGAVPLLAAVRFWRLRPHLQRVNRKHSILPRVLPLLFLGLGLHSLGEGWGYLFGTGNSMQHKGEFEYFRYRFLSSSDREAIAYSGPGSGTQLAEEALA